MGVRRAQRSCVCSCTIDLGVFLETNMMVTRTEYVQDDGVRLERLLDVFAK